MIDEGLENFRNLLNSDEITSPDEFWEYRVVDMYYLLDMDKEVLASIFKYLLERIQFPKCTQINKRHDNYRFFDIYADYYNDENISVSVALIDEGYNNCNLADITIKQLFSIDEFNGRNVEIFTDKILAAHRYEYGY